MLPHEMTGGNENGQGDGTILVRSTIHLPEVGRGRVFRADPSQPYIAGALERGFLVPLEEDIPAAEPVGDPVVEEPVSTTDPHDLREASQIAGELLAQDDAEEQHEQTPEADDDAAQLALREASAAFADGDA